MRFWITRIADFASATGALAIFPGAFRTVVIDEAVYSELLDSALINDLVALHSRIEGINHSLEDTQHIYEQTKDAFISGKFTRGEYAAGMQLCDRDLQTTKREIEAILPEVRRMQARVRLQAKKDNTRIWFVLALPRVAQLTKEEVDAEDRKLEGELSASIERSRAQIDRAQANS